MAFKGTRGAARLQIAEEIEDVGGYINAYTSAR
jgi:predicted Zn-dependent peptidase